MILYNNVFSGGKTEDNIVKITVDEIKELANNSELDTNKIYQITDYQINSFSPNAGIYGSRENYYDILVTANSSNKLNMNAAATKHENDNYYNEIDLSQWQLKYAIQNITYGYDSGIEDLEYPTYDNNKGIILYLKDHKNNEALFDFKNLTINGYLLFDDKNKIDNSQKEINTGVRNTSYLTLPYLFNYLGSTKYVNIFGDCNNIKINGQSKIVHEMTSTFNISQIKNLELTGTMILKSSGHEFYDVKIINCGDLNIGSGMNVEFDNVNIINCKDVTIETYSMKYTTIKNLSQKTVSHNYTNGDPFTIFCKEEDKITIVS